MKMSLTLLPGNHWQLPWNVPAFRTIPDAAAVPADTAAASCLKEMYSFLPKATAEEWQTRCMAMYMPALHIRCLTAESRSLSNKQLQPKHEETGSVIDRSLKYKDPAVCGIFWTRHGNSAADAIMLKYIQKECSEEHKEVKNDNKEKEYAL